MRLSKFQLLFHKTLKTISATKLNAFKSFPNKSSDWSKTRNKKIVRKEKMKFKSDHLLKV